MHLVSSVEIKVHYFEITASLTSAGNQIQMVPEAYNLAKPIHHFGIPCGFPYLFLLDPFDEFIVFTAYLLNRICFIYHL